LSDGHATLYRHGRFLALEATLVTHKDLAPDGRPLINSANGKKEHLRDVLPLAAGYGTAVIGMVLDDEGVSHTPEARLAVARESLERAEAAGIPRQNVVIDCLALSLSTDPQAARVTLDSIRRVRQKVGVNMTLGPSNVSFGLPQREKPDWAFMAMAILNGVNCPIVDVPRDRWFIMAIDAILVKDQRGLGLIEAHGHLY
jgi:5-methyltetrahydrofolate--homocysteine methyltransferase